MIHLWNIYLFIGLYLCYRNISSNLEEVEKIENVQCCQSYSLHLKMQNLINMNNFPENTMRFVSPPVGHGVQPQNLETHW